eukprot:1193672-Prorocentrum_minimum.AAC.2
MRKSSEVGSLPLKKHVCVRVAIPTPKTWRRVDDDWPGLCIAAGLACLCVRTAFAPAISVVPTAQVTADMFEVVCALELKISLVQQQLQSSGKRLRMVYGATFVKQASLLSIRMVNRQWRVRVNRNI